MERCIPFLNAGERKGSALCKEQQNVVGHLHLLAVQFSKKDEIGLRREQSEMLGSLLDNALPRYSSGMAFAMEYCDHKYEILDSHLNGCVCEDGGARLPPNSYYGIRLRGIAGASFNLPAEWV